MAAATDNMAPNQPTADILREADELLVQGKRHMALEDYQAATDSFEQAVQLYDAFYGVAKIQCADAYLEYGTALVALANVEAGTGADRLVKDTGLEEDNNDADEDDDDCEDEEMATSESADKATTDSTTDSQGGVAKNGKDAPGSTEMATDETANKASESSSAPTSASTTEQTSTPGESTSQTDKNGAEPSQGEPLPGTSSGKTQNGAQDADDGDQSENEEATTIEIAWEVLCLAKRLFMTDESLEGRIKLTETLQKLGEISIEWENNDNAVSILEECLNIRKSILTPDDRLIAVTYYNLGLAHSFKSETEKANENFQHAMDVIQRRIETLQAKHEKAKKTQDVMAVSGIEKEISELKELIPDITMRMDDTPHEEDSNGSEALKRIREEQLEEDEGAKKFCQDISKPVDNISHLVKRKP